MEKKAIITIAIIGILAAAFITWTAVGVFYGEEILEEEDEKKDINIFISGSTTCFPIVVRCAAEFEDDNTEYNFAVSAGGSSVGISNVINDISHLGIASRPLKDSEKALEPSIRQIAIANDGIALIMSAGNEHFEGDPKLIPQWTLEDVLKVWNGTYDTWDDVPGCTGGPDDPIHLVGRDSNSGTRASFEEITGLEDDAAYQGISKDELPSNGAVHLAVAGDEDAIGYVGLGYVDSAVDTIDLWNVDNFYQATVANVKSGDYLISRKLYMIYKAPLNDDYKEFIDWIRSDGQAIVEDEGFVTL